MSNRHASTLDDIESGLSALDLDVFVTNPKFTEVMEYESVYPDLDEIEYRADALLDDGRDYFSADADAKTSEVASALERRAAQNRLVSMSRRHGSVSG